MQRYYALRVDFKFRPNGGCFLGVNYLLIFKSARARCFVYDRNLARINGLKIARLCRQIELNLMTNNLTFHFYLAGEREAGPEPVLTRF